MYKMTVYSFPAAKRQCSRLGAQLWVVGEARWLCWGPGLREERRKTVCLELAGERKRSLGRREKATLGDPGRKAERQKKPA